VSDPTAEIQAGLDSLGQRFRERFAATQNEQDLRAAKAEVLGKKGDLTAALRRMGEVPPADRKSIGERVNAVKNDVETAFAERLSELQRALREADLGGRPIDLTLPGRVPVARGHLHPVTRVKDEILDIFRSLGFEIAWGPEVDFETNNFEKLAFPPDHPATDMQDSFWVKVDGAPADARMLLRTHTSTVQVREMTSHRPPMAIVSGGTVYRRDDDVTHSPMFHQIEGFLVDENVSFAMLKGVLTGALSSQLLPLRRTRCRGRRGLRVLSSRRRLSRELSRLQVERLARDPRLRHGSPSSVRALRNRSREVHGLRVRSRRRTRGDAPLRHSGHSPFVRERPALSGAVLSVIRRRARLATRPARWPDRKSWPDPGRA
jgi:phenylalanyl-tRNA synthetase alpha subunit